VLQADPLIKLMQSDRGCRCELIPLPVLNACWMGEEGLLDLLSQQARPVQELVTAKSPGTELLKMGLPPFGFELAKALLPLVLDVSERFGIEAHA
jgi:hypothetical protein